MLVRLCEKICVKICVPKKRVSVGLTSCETAKPSHTCPVYTNGYNSSNWWSIGTNGTIGTNGKAPYSNGSVGAYASN